MANFKEEIAHIRAFIFDVDGVFTDGSITMIGRETVRTYNAKDGFAVAMAVKMGYPVAIVSGGRGDSIQGRFEALGVKDIYMGSADKMADVGEFLCKYNLSPADALFVGDDIPDIEVMSLVRISACPADAVPEIKAVARYISGFDGGRGCVRDLIEQVLKVQNRWVDWESNHSLDPLHALATQCQSI